MVVRSPHSEVVSNKIGGVLRWGERTMCVTCSCELDLVDTSRRIRWGAWIQAKAAGVRPGSSWADLEGLRLLERSASGRIRWHR